MRLAERSLGLDVFRIQVTFDDDFGIRRNHDIDRFTLDHRNRLAGQTAGHTHFIDPVRNFLHRNIGHNGRCADD